MSQVNKPEDFELPDTPLVTKVETSKGFDGRTPMAQASYSRLSFYKNCPYAYKLKYVDKMPTNAAPVQKDRQGNVKPPAWQRGSRIHQAMDDYINSRTDALIPELQSLKHEINSARELMITDPKRVLTEQNKYFDLDYNLIDMDKLENDQKSLTSGGDKCPLHYHVLIIIDLLIFNEDFTHATVIDLKSGKRRNNEVKHGQQTQLYGLFTAIEYPNLEIINTQLWYCDLSGQIIAKEYKRDDILLYLNFWDRSINKMHKDLEFIPNSAEPNCIFCEYKDPKYNTMKKYINPNGLCLNARDKLMRI
jgi:hypothetical protein